MVDVAAPMQCLDGWEASAAEKYRTNWPVGRATMSGAQTAPDDQVGRVGRACKPLGQSEWR